MPDQPVYSIGALARMLGIPAATLRTWEERYGVVVPERSPGGHRLYSRLQVEQLRFVGDRLSDGMSVGDAYRLHGSRYDDYEFVEEKPGLLWDRRHVLGTISRGTLTFETPGRLGRADPVTVLDVQFCYEFFYLFGTAGPEVFGQAPPTRPAGSPADGKGAPVTSSGTSKE